MSHIKHEVTCKAGVINKVMKLECKKVKIKNVAVAFLTKCSTVK